MLTAVVQADLLCVQANRKLAMYLKYAVELTTIFKRIYHPKNVTALKTTKSIMLILTSTSWKYLCSF